MTFTLNPHTKTESMVIALIGLWLYYKEELEREYVPVSELIYEDNDNERFKPSKAYDFFADLRGNELAEPYGKDRGSIRNLLRPTSKGITYFLEYFRNRLERKQSSKEKSDIEVVTLKKTCESLEKLQTLFFSDPRE